MLFVTPDLVLYPDLDSDEREEEEADWSAVTHSDVDTGDSSGLEA